jgi:Taurine catabolism dioxygenase TauD, TfdA family
VLRRQDSSLVKILEYRLFRIASPTSLRGDGGSRLMSEPRPLVVNYNGFKTISGNVQTLVAEPAAQSALEAFERALESVARPILIRTGSALLFSNTAALHGRVAIATPRWLQRCYMRRSLDTLREACDSPGGRIFSMAEIIG